MKVKAIWFASLAHLWLGASVALYGQNIRGSMVGHVTDSSGAAVPGAQITVTNKGTGIAVKTTTDAAGTYTVPDLLDENKALNANYFDFNAHDVPQNPFNRNQFGGNLRGPILRDKLFFFINYDGIREIHPGPTSINFPSVAMTHGDFSALCSSYSND